MNRLEEQFGDRIEFFHLDVGLVETLPIREQFGMTRRSQYQLLDPEGEPVQTWFGPLYEESVVMQIEAQLADLEQN